MPSELLSSFAPNTGYCIRVGVNRGCCPHLVRGAKPPRTLVGND